MLHRDLHALRSQRFDVLVVGGGASGAATAREAALRGYATALIEKDDFSAGASAHCFKVVHGGIRYLQHADIQRMRASCRERSTFLRIAPHLVAPMPFVIPTYGHGKSSKWLLGTGMLIYDAFTQDCNRTVSDRARRISRTRFLNPRETLALFPALDPKGLTGAAIFEDGQMYNPPRLVLAFAAAAQANGASIANHVAAERLLIEGGQVVGIMARDVITSETFEIRAKLTINAAGPWAEEILESAIPAARNEGTYSRDACFVISRKPTTRMALAVQGQTRDADAVLARKARHLFLVPWRDVTLVGVWHRVVPRDPDSVGLERTELRGFIAEINASWPALKLREDEVRIAGFGLVPFGDAAGQGSGKISFGKQSRLIDHAARDALPGLISIISVRYTVARMDAVTALDLADHYLGRSGASEESERRPLPGGEIESFEGLVRELAAKRPAWLAPESIDALARNYGTHAHRVLALGGEDAALARNLPGSTVTFAEVAYALRQEMALTMADVAFRRTALATDGHPGNAALDALEEYMSGELGWSAQRRSAERAAVQTHLDRYLAAYH